MDPSPRCVGGDPDPNNPYLVVIDWGNLDTPPRDDAASETEAWLRSEEAFDVVTDVWLKLLEDVDPSLGYGLPAQIKQAQS